MIIAAALRRARTVSACALATSITFGACAADPPSRATSPLRASNVPGDGSAAALLRGVQERFRSPGGDAAWVRSASAKFRRRGSWLAPVWPAGDERVGVELPERAGGALRMRDPRQH